MRCLLHVNAFRRGPTWKLIRRKSTARFRRSTCRSTLAVEDHHPPPIWLSTDLRDGNQALIEPMDVERKLRMFRPAGEDRLQGDRGRISLGVADRLRLRPPADRRRPDSRRRDHPGADAGARRADPSARSSRCAAPSARSSICTTRRRRCSGASCSARTRPGSSTSRSRARELCRQCAAEQPDDRLALRVFAGDASR